MTDQTQSRPEIDQVVAHFEERYRWMFGAVPPLPAKRIAYLARVAPDRLRRDEATRQDAFTGNAFGDKVSQLILTAVLAAQGSPAVRWHAEAARRAGASEDELLDVIELAAAAAALGVQNTSYAAMDDLD